MVDNVFDKILRRSTLIKLVEYFKKDPIVKSAKLHYDHIDVKYNSGITQTFGLSIDSHRKLIIPKDPFKGSKLEISQEIINDLDKSYSHLKILSYKKFKKGSYVEKKLIVQKMTKYILDNGLIPKYPNEFLIDDLKRISNINPHLYKGCIKIYGFYARKAAPGRILIDNFTPQCKNVTALSKDSYYVAGIIKKILKAKKNVSIHSILIRMNRSWGTKKIKKSEIRFICPSVYIAILRHFKISNLVVGDPQIDYGNKQIAFSIENCVYYNNSQYPELTSFLGSNVGLFNLEHYDLLYVDYKFKKSTQVEDINKWLKMADSVIIYVPHSFIDKMPKPTQYTKIIIKKEDEYRFKHEINYIFYYA